MLLGKKNMENSKVDEKTEDLQNNHFQLYTLENAELFQEITAAISKHVKFENKSRYSTDEILDVLGEIVDSVQEEFF